MGNVKCIPIPVYWLQLCGDQPSHSVWYQVLVPASTDLMTDRNEQILGSLKIFLLNDVIGADTSNFKFDSIFIIRYSLLFSSLYFRRGV